MEEEKGGEEFQESEVIDKTGLMGADIMNELLCCLIKCLGIHIVYLFSQRPLKMFHCTALSLTRGLAVNVMHM